MCPSFMVTREEQHSTRGRARLLFEMLQGEIIRDGWRSEAVKEALDLCLACKGCKNDCPVNVDMATYKAEFLSHYYEGRLRPLPAYAFGLIHRWARIAAWAPELVNLMTQTPGLRHVLKWVAGIAQKRQLPRFAPGTFKQRLAQTRRGAEGASDVILWPDTFNNHFHPETAEAALRVLEAAGYRVEVPQAPLCCGRPLYDYGMLETAKGLLLEVLDYLGPSLKRGVPVVVLEPSCASVFRDELINLFPDHENAKRLRDQTFLLSEFLRQNANGFSPPVLQGKAIVQGHCHQKALMGIDSDTSLFARLGLNADILDSGCCGMAGAFGYEKGSRYQVSIKAGERVLLPAVRAAAATTWIIADGFSCREQIRQATGREALHSAQVVQLALDPAARGPAGGHPETPFIQLRERQQAKSRRTALYLLGAAAMLAGVWANNRRSGAGAQACGL